VGAGVAVIASFHDDETRRIWEGKFSRKLPQQIQNARVLDDLRIPPNNRLEALRGDRVGQHSIRINEQWRVCFIWMEGRAERVEICDYH
jgi:proteic killer suppression protein